MVVFDGDIVVVFGEASSVVRVATRIRHQSQPETGIYSSSGAFSRLSVLVLRR